MYEYTDKVIRYLTKQIIRTFGNAKGLLLSFDELNVLDYSAEMYKSLEKVNYEAYYKLAVKSYKDNLIKGKTGKVPSRKWLAEFLLLYDPVTKYVYQHEVERKRSRFAEAVIASPTPEKTQAVDSGMKSWSQQTNQYAIGVTDAAALKAFKDSGVKRVIWVTEPDEKRCRDCKELDGNIYDIDIVPPKPHIRCRCRVKPYL